MAEERSMDRGASATLKSQDLTDGIYEDARTDVSKGPFGANTTSDNNASQTISSGNTDPLPDQKATVADREAEGGEWIKEEAKRNVDRILGAQ
ncbi:hypothetical protein PRZ48_002859 [Zasmidium cellare]|uniref:Uncharacterized protein n=1 Tax=Zasmidium cellare TaxID=395010 RepID=A0ABR0EUM8_ZASCE|nr:hypothetical protein PRZ48_002859 [Zasmidium cellare]